MRTAIKSLNFSIIIGLILWATLSTAQAFKCDGKIISKGDSKIRVVSLCGNPDHVDTWVEERSVRKYRYVYKKKQGKYYRTIKPYWTTEQVEIEKWTYNYGPYRFLKHLYFFQGEVREIESGKRGF